MISVSVREPTDVAEARRQAAGFAQFADFDEIEAGRVAIVATELATNVIRHGGGGEMLICRRGDQIELIALDKGPGIADLAASMVDGFSTGGTPGQGLGAVRRQARSFEVFSRPGQGAAVLARLGPEVPAPTVAGVRLPYPGETVCGDDWRWRREGDGLLLMMADGLGHGILAAEASAAACLAFERRTGATSEQILQAAHAALRVTRGAAVAVARLEAARVTFAGVGNVAGVVVSAQGSKKMISHNGTLGHIAKRFQAFDYPAQAPYIVVMHSDGLASSWSLDAYPGLAFADPALVAAVLYRDFNRGRDDVTVAVARGP